MYLRTGSAQDYGKYGRNPGAKQSTINGRSARISTTATDVIAIAIAIRHHSLTSAIAMECLRCPRCSGWPARSLGSAAARPRSRQHFPARSRPSPSFPGGAELARGGNSNGAWVDRISAKNYRPGPAKRRRKASLEHVHRVKYSQQRQELKLAEIRAQDTTPRALSPGTRTLRGVEEVNANDIVMCKYKRLTTLVSSERFRVVVAWSVCASCARATPIRSFQDCRDMFRYHCSTTRLQFRHEIWMSVSQNVCAQNLG